jgi:hypothetical protein
MSWVVGQRYALPHQNWENGTTPAKFCYAEGVTFEVIENRPKGGKQRVVFGNPYDPNTGNITQGVTGAMLLD